MAEAADSTDTPVTIAEMFQRSVADRPEDPARGAVVDGQLVWRTWRQLHGDVAQWAAALRDRGVGVDVHVGQIGGNSYEWIVVDLAIHFLGGVHIPLHAALTVDQALEQLAGGEAALTVVDHRLPSAEQLIESLSADRFATHEQLHAEAAGMADSSEADAPASRQADDLATILFTSGTTGQPLGVMLTHGNLVSNAIATTEAVDPPGDEVRLCVLPLSHIYARTCDLYSWLYRGTQLILAETRETILRDCQIAQPTVMNAVPYFYRKVAQVLHEKLGVVDETALRGAFGGKLEGCFCGGAGIAPETEKFYSERGLPIRSGYGLTEAGPVITATSLQDYRPGMVGPALANTEVRLADDGEILARGPGISPGYWRNQEATEAAFRDGWLATGDLGEWEDGFLRIVGRKKEIIVLATGKNVAPTRIEEQLASSNLIEQVCVVGNERNFLTALIVPNPTALRAEIRQRRLWVWSRRRALRHRVVRALYRREIDRCLQNLAGFEQIGEFTLLGRAFDAEAGELTPKMSLRRSAIQANFSPQIERMYRRGKSPADSGRAQT